MELWVPNKVEFGYDDIDDAFPPINSGGVPCGDSAIFQLRAPKRKTKGGIILAETTKDIEAQNTQVAKVVALGPLCFRDPDTHEQWPEGNWYDEGDFVRVPKFGGDRWHTIHGEGDDATEITFVLFRARDIRLKITGDPLKMKTYI